METTRICKECRLPLPADAPEGLCPACLAKVALGTEPAAGATVNISPLAGQAATGTRVPPDVADLAAQFPQLEIIEMLGMGGMGMVYKARQPRLDRFVALKILPIDSTRGASFAERFEREARALARLNHPGIVTLFDFGQTREYYFFIMEYVDGMNLRQLLHTQPLEPRQALELVGQICTALQFAHDEKIVHRDIKPENILINKKGQVKIADFGLAKLLGAAPDTALTMSQAAMGTMNYMAPEQRQNAQGVDHRADIYSLGVVFYEMLTGEVPMGRFEPPSKRVQVDVRLDEVVLRALEREPARRYQQVSEVKSNVDSISSTMPKAPANPPAAQTTSIRPQNFVNVVVKPMSGLFVIWLALWFFARNWSYIAGLALLFSGLPVVLVVWRIQAAVQGLDWRQLPPAVRHRGNRRLNWIAAACVAALVCGYMVFPSRRTEWREEWFSPKSNVYEKCVLSGNITGYQIPFWSSHSVLGSGTLALKIYRKDSPPVGLTFSLPGLLVETDSHDPGQPTQALTMDGLTNWMHDIARLNLAEPKVQAEARQLMELFQPYSETAPGSWRELSDSAIAKMPDFVFGGSNTPLAESGALGPLFFIMMAFPGALACLYYFLALPTLKGAFAEGRAEIEAGRWTPPPATKVPPTTAPSAAPLPSQPRISKTALVGAACFILLVAVVVNSFVFDLYTMPKGHWQYPPGRTDAHGDYLLNTFVEPSLTGWRIAVVISAVLALASVSSMTVCGWVAVHQIRRSAGTLYGLALALFDGMFLPLFLANSLVFLLLMAGFFWNARSAIASTHDKVSPLGSIPIFPIFVLIGLIVVLLNFFVVRKVWRICRR